MEKRNYLFPFTLVMLLFLWETVVRLANIPEYVLPSPTAIVNQSIEVYLLLAGHFLVTLQEVLIGMSVGIPLAIIVAIIFHWSGLARAAFFPYARGINSTPIVIIASMIIVWFGIGIESKIIVAIICTLFPIVVHICNGLDSVDPLREKFMDARNASKLEKLIYLEFPSIAGEFFSALETVVTYVIVGIFFAEMIGSNKGLGFYNQNLMYRMETAKMLLVTAATMGMGVTLATIVAKIKESISKSNSNRR